MTSGVHIRWQNPNETWNNFAQAADNFVQAVNTFVNTANAMETADAPTYNANAIGEYNILGLTGRAQARWFKHVYF